MRFQNIQLNVFPVHTREKGVDQEFSVLHSLCGARIDIVDLGDGVSHPKKRGVTKMSFFHAFTQTGFNAALNVNTIFGRSDELMLDLDMGRLLWLLHVPKIDSGPQPSERI